jgi:hypothetical protein
MNTQNMKLLDLETGEYLKLGKEGFFYGGKTITCPPTKSFDIQNVEDMILHIYADTEKDYDIKRLDDSLCPSFEITCKSNNQKLIGREVGHIDMRFNRVIEQTEPPLELKEICEKVGAVVYGKRYVLLHCETWTTQDKVSVELMHGHIFRRKVKNLKYYEDTPIFLIDKETLLKLSGIKDDYITYSFETSCYSRQFLSTTLLKSLFKGNIFEEYSKQLRKEENKFDELKELLK